MKLARDKKRLAFTLVELLVVIAIIGLLSTVAVISLGPARMKARDAKRLADMRQIQTALELYRDINGSYPPITDSDSGCGGWDAGKIGGSSGSDVFIPELESSNLLKTPADPVPADCRADGWPLHGYFYYHYSAGSGGCDVALGSFYVLGIADMETSGNPYPTSPGWSCPGFNWQTYFEWVTGGFDK